MAYFLYRYLMQLISFLAGRSGFANVKLKNRNQGLIAQVIPDLERCIWIHCASLGEFEQGKVLIDALRTRYPNQQLVLTFFSSSGYEKRRNYDAVDAVLYLPYDTPGAMGRFVDQLQPELVVFIKYEFWFTLLDILATRKIPFVFVSASFRSSQYLFQPLYSSLLNRIIKANHIFVQNNTSRDILVERQYKAVTVAGDTRIDRVLELRNQEFVWPALVDWIGERTTFIGGSTWPKDENLIADVISKFDHWKWILAPHEIGRDHLHKMAQRWGDDVVYLSEVDLDQDIPPHKNILIIDRIGLLSLLYRYGDIAYIGGGHGAGIHNTLEPAVYGVPLIFGPNYTKFQEAVDFTENGTAQVVQSPSELEDALESFDNPNKRDAVKQLHREYFECRSGATTKIMRTIEKIINQK